MDISKGIMRTLGFLDAEDDIMLSRYPARFETVTDTPSCSMMPMPRRVFPPALIFYTCTTFSVQVSFASRGVPPLLLPSLLMVLPLFDLLRDALCCPVLGFRHALFSHWLPRDVTHPVSTTVGWCLLILQPKPPHSVGVALGLGVSTRDIRAFAIRFYS